MTPGPPFGQDRRDDEAQPEREADESQPPDGPDALILTALAMLVAFLLAFVVTFAPLLRRTPRKRLNRRA